MQCNMCFCKHKECRYVLSLVKNTGIEVCEAWGHVKKKTRAHTHTRTNTYDKAWL